MVAFFRFVGRLIGVIVDYFLLLGVLGLVVAAAVAAAAVALFLVPFILAAFWLILLVYVAAAVMTMMWSPRRGDRTHGWRDWTRGGLIMAGLAVTGWLTWHFAADIGATHGWLIEQAGALLRPAAAPLADLAGWPPTEGVTSRAAWLASWWQDLLYRPLAVPRFAAGGWTALLAVAGLLVFVRILRRDARMREMERP